MLVLVICLHSTAGSSFILIAITTCTLYVAGVYWWLIAALVCQPVRVRFLGDGLKKRLLPMVDPRNLVILGDYNINLSIQSHAWNFCGRGASWTLLNLDNFSYVYKSWWNFVGKNLHPGLCCWIFSFSYNANMNYQATQVISIEIKTISYRYSYTTTAS